MISFDTIFSTYASFDKMDIETLATLSVNSYVVCIHDSNWYIGLISEIHTDKGDATIKFMHPHGASYSFYWPKKKKMYSAFHS